MREDTWNDYWNAAREYYLQKPHLIKSLDLTTAGTELASHLGDYVMSTSLPNTGDSSCGEAVGMLLNRFWIKDLPQAERNGKNWTRFLTDRWDQFKKVAIRHPDEASAWAILVYDGSWELGSDMNKKFWHVEIKWSDMWYYHYLKSNESAWSAHKWDKEKDPIKYRDLTGFTGYAYYPVTKKA